MDELHRYRFDLEGFIVVRDAIPPDEFARVDAALDDLLSHGDCAHAAGLRLVDEPVARHPAFRELIANPRVLPYLEAWVDAHVRLDHTYAQVLSRGFPGSRLHGGMLPYDPTAWYRVDGEGIRNGLTVVAYNLRDISPGDGGFACIPGSHKSAFRMPEALRDLSAGPRDVVRQVVAPAGSAVIFTEALVHGTLPWHGAGDRRTLFFKYAPRSTAWSARSYDADTFADLPPLARAMLEPPNARYISGRADAAPIRVRDGVGALGH